MRLIDEALLAQFRGPGRCEYCLFTFMDREAHHIYCRGMGGGKRLDHYLNLISLCSAFDNGCHAKAQANKIGYKVKDMLRLVAFREKMTVEAVEEELGVLLL